MALTKITSRTIEPGSISSNSLSQDVVETISSAAGGVSPVIANVQIANSTYGVLDDTAVSLSGGYIILNGNNFGSNTQLVIGDTLASSITVVSNTVIRAQVPAKTAGSYILYLTNQETGSVAIRVNGLTYSGTPTWVTGSTLTEAGVNEAISIQLSATADSNVSYQLQAGSSLPAGLSLAANGLLTGTVTGIENETTYNFIVEAIDAENQESPRSFSITITVGDPYFYLTTLLLNGDGTNGANNNTFVDSSTNNFAITRVGNATQGTFSPFSVPDGRWSNYFDGSGDNLQISYNSALHLSGDFTIECWIYPTSSSGGQIINFAGGLNIAWASYEFKWNGNSVNFAASSVNNGYDIGSETGTTGKIGDVPLHQWHHVAVTRSGNVYRGFLNGVQGYTQTLSLTPYDPNARGLTIGSNYTTTWGVAGNVYDVFAGHISNVRIVKGTAIYTSNFTPSTSPLTTITNTSLLTCQSNRFKDNSTNNFAFTRNGDVKVTSFSPFAPTGSYSAATNGGSGYFDGTSDNLQISYASNLAAGTAAYSFEVWVYFTGTGTHQGVIGTTSDGFAGFERSNGSWAYYNGLAAANTGVACVLGQWNHVVICRNGLGNGAFFVNGVRLATFTDTANKANFGNLQIGYNGVAGGNFTTGYITDYRYVKGSNPYNPLLTTLTVPSAPLTATAETMVLISSTNASIIDYTGKNNLETVGTSRIDTNVKKYGTGSIILSPGGGSHYTQMPLTEELKFGTGDFTIECWIYLITNPAGICAVWSNYSSFSAGSLSLFAGHSSANINLFHIAHNGGFPALSSSTTVNSRLNTWTHLAVVRYNGQIKLYVNGTSEGTPFASTVALNGVGTSFWVGTTGDSTAANPNCYIDDFRVTKGIARYTSNFTPPTSAHRLR